MYERAALIYRCLRLMPLFLLLGLHICVFSQNDTMNGKANMELNEIFENVNHNMFHVQACLGVKIY